MNSFDDVLDEEEQRLRADANSAPRGRYEDELDYVLAEQETRRNATLGASLRASVGANPDQVAKQTALSRSTGIPLPTVARNEDLVAAQARVRELQQLSRLSPVLARQLSDPAFAALAHDDAEQLSLTENVTRALKRGFKGTQQGTAAETVRESFALLDLVERIERGELKDDAAIMNASPYGSMFMGVGRTPEALADRRKQLHERIASNIAEYVQRGPELEALPASTAHQRMSGAETFGGAVSAFTDAPARISSEVLAESLGAMAPMLPLIVGSGVAGGVRGLAYATGLSSAATEYLNSLPELFAEFRVDVKDQAAVRQLVLSPEFQARMRDKLAKAAVVGTVDAATAGVVGRVLAPARLTGAPRAVVNLAAQTGVQAAGGAGGEVLGSLAAGEEIQPGAVLAEMIAEGPSAVVDVGVIAARRAMLERGKAEAAQQDAQALQAVSEAATASKLRERDPQAFQAFMEVAAGEDGAQDLFLNANALQQAGIDPAQLVQLAPSVAPQLAEAVATGGDIVIPTAEFAAHLAGTDLGKALIPHLRVDAEAMSQAEAQAFFQDERFTEGLRVDMQKFAAEQADLDAQVRGTAGDVREVIRQELAKTGRFTDEVVNSYAEAASAFYVSMASRMSMTPEQFMEQYPVHVASQLNFEAANTLEQGREGTRIRGRDGSPLVVFRGAAQPLAAEHFNPQNFSRASGNPSSGLGVWFTPSHSEATGYGNVEGFQLNIRNPAIYKVEDLPGFDSPEEALAFRQALERQGHDGIVISGRHLGDGAHIVAFSPEQVTRPDQSVLEQATRGAYQPSTKTIALLQNADLSTFLHELGHHFLEVHADLATRADAPDQVRHDMQKLLGWFGVKDLDAWRAMSLEQKREHHETFARGFEHWLMEGEAPSLELANVFQRFRAWMLYVYRSLTSLNVKLSDEVRGVFNRMLATDAQIAVAEAARSYRPLFANAEEAGMTAQQWNEYQRMRLDATAEAQQSLERRSLRDMQWLRNARSRKLKELQAAAEAKRAELQHEAEAEIHKQPVFAARRFLERGILPEGTQAVGAKLDLDALKEMYGDGPAAPWRYLALGQFGLAGKEGLHPDAVAQMFGFTSGDHLVRSLLSAGRTQDAIEGLTDQRMLERYGDLTSPQALERATEAALHNEARGRFVAAELNALSKANKPERVLAHAARQFAQETLARKLIRAIRPAQFATATGRAAREAEKSLKAGDLGTAAAHKRAQLVNHQLTRVAYAAVEEVEKGVAYLRGFNRDGTRKALDVDYLDQIDQLLERHDLRPSVTQKELRKRASLREWIEAQREMGLEPVIGDELLNDTNLLHYREMTLEAFRGMVDAVTNIEHLGRLKKTLLTAKDAREFAAVVDELSASIRSNANRTVKSALEPERSDIAQFFADHRKLSSIAREMDGGKDAGGLWERFIRPMNAAADKEAAMREAATLKLAELLKPVVKGEKLAKKLYIPAIGASLSREGRISVALNWGNAQNRQRVMGGEGWSPQQVQAVLDTLTREDWNFVQGVWDYLESFWPRIREKERRVTGVTPEQVQPMPVQTQFGELRGGYYPIAYDAQRSSKAEADDAAEVIRQTMQGLYTRAQTRRGHTKARMDEVNRPVRKDFGVIFGHINQVIHDLAWHEWLIDANRLLGAKAIDAAVRDHYGPEILRTMKGALKDIAQGELAAQDAFERWIGHARHGATIAGLGWNVATAALQPLGLTQSAVRIGPQWVARGLVRWARGAASLEKTVEQIGEKSTFMRLRAKTMQREINEVQGQVSGKSAARKLLEASYFIFIQKAQLIADVPTWLGQYEKSLAEGKDDGTAIALADQAVRDAQGAGQISDLAGIQRGGALKKLFTTFYSFFNTTYNLAAERTRATRFTDPVAVARLAGDYLLLFVLPATLGAVLKGILKGDLEDDPEELAKKLVLENLGYLLGSVVGLRELGAALQDYRYAGAAGARIFSEANKLTQQVLDGEIDAGLLKALNQVGGILFHYPAGQVERTVSGALAIGEGRAGPQAVLVGPPKR